MFNNTFIQDLIKFKNNSKLIIIINFINCLVLFFVVLITPKGINKLSLTLIGVLNCIGGISVSQLNNDLNLRLDDLQLTNRIVSKDLLSSYLKDKDIEINLPTIPIEDKDIIFDVVSYWKSQDKHLAIIGGTGDGKSYTVKLFVNAFQSDYSIAAYDVDYSRGDYPECVDVKFEYQEIEQALNDDMEELENRIAERRIQGKNYLPKKKLIISEETPALADECDSLGIWMRKMSKRGRKVGMFIIAIAQNDTAENFSLKGDSAILNANFCLLYLGNKAKIRAKQLKNEVLFNWLNEASKGRGLIDDKPCLIESNHVFMPSTALPLPELIDSTESPKSPSIPETEVVEVPENTAVFDTKMVEIGRKLIGEGYSKTKIIKLLWQVDGGARFTQLSKLLDD